VRWAPGCQLAGDERALQFGSVILHPLAVWRLLMSDVANPS
jgi:hypothetical protein